NPSPAHRDLHSFYTTLFRSGGMDRRSAEKAASEALESVGLADKQDLFAHQLNVMSRKWLEVARALATRPRLLLLDEFMAGLNPRSEEHTSELQSRENLVGRL